MACRVPPFLPAVPSAAIPQQIKSPPERVRSPRARRGHICATAGSSLLHLRSPEHGSSSHRKRPRSHSPSLRTGSPRPSPPRVPGGRVSPQIPPELRAQAPAWASPEDSSHPRLHALFQLLQRVPGAGVMLEGAWFPPRLCHGSTNPEQTARWLQARGEAGRRWEHPNSPNTQSPALRDFPAWMQVLFYPHWVFLLSWIPWSPNKL